MKPQTKGKTMDKNHEINGRLERIEARGNEVHRLLVEPSKEKIRRALARVEELIIEDSVPKVLSAGPIGKNAAEPMKKDKGERTFTQKELIYETKLLPPGWTDEMFDAVHDFTGLQKNQRAKVALRFHKIVGPSGPIIPDGADADWWSETDNRRPDALLLAMKETGFIKTAPVEAVVVSNNAQQVTDTKQEQPNLPASEPNSEQIVETQVRNGKVEAVVDASRKAESRGEPSPRQEYFGLNDLLERYPKVKDAGAGATRTWVK